MFKLESYVTPLLVNYVNKYVKNLKPEDSQLYFWDGDAIFSNLDLRLDVLEQELDLPFTFVNGHIQELRIHVPWTKIGSEPIVITINTIECVLKLSVDNNALSDSSGQVSQCSNSPPGKKFKKEEMPDAPPSYVQSLINRIISNICIVCNNVILKYVEDDIVLSLNIKSVELYNVNEEWERAFVDINIAEAIVQKILSMQDLTVCLDKRDASGKIEVYQDPLLYRCSTVWRIRTVYNSSNAKYPLVTRINMFCEKLDFSLTDQQLPMFLRLAKLCYALQFTDEYSNKDSKESEISHPDKGHHSESSSEETETKYQDDSWSTWMWSFVPFSWERTEDENEEAEKAKLQKILQFGIFIKEASCIFKVIKAISDQCCASAKYSFVPFSLLQFYGCYMEITVRGKDFVNMQLAAIGASASAQNSCVCGYSGSSQAKPFVVFGEQPSGEDQCCEMKYLSSTLFDPDAPENNRKHRKYCFDAEQHLSQLTEDVMVEKFPGFFFDYVYALEIPEEWLDKISQVTSTFLEDSNWQERSVCRFVLGPFRADVTSHFVHTVEKIVHCCMDYDYPSHLSSQASMSCERTCNIRKEDIEELEAFTPLRLYQLILFKPVICLFAADHKNFGSDSRLHKKKKRKKKRNSDVSLDPVKLDSSCIALEVGFEKIEICFQKTMYPERYAKIVSTIAMLSEQLCIKCFSHYSVHIQNMKALLLKQDHHFGGMIVPPMTLSLKMESLNCPQYWINQKNFPLKKLELSSSLLHFCLKGKQFLALMCIYLSWTSKDFNFENHSLIFKDNDEDASQIQFETCGIKYFFIESQYASINKGSVSSILMKLEDSDHSSIIIQGPELIRNISSGQTFCSEECDINDSNKLPGYWFKFLLHFPNKLAEGPCTVMGSMEGTAIYLEPALLTWLGNYLPTYVQESVSGNHKTLTDIDDESMCSSHTTPAVSGSQSVSRDQSSVGIHSKDNTSTIDFAKRFLLGNHGNLILEVDLAGFAILCPKSPWCVPAKNESSLESWRHAISQKHLTHATFFCFPKVYIKNSGSSSISSQLSSIKEKDLLLYLTKDEGKSDYFPWTLKIEDFSIYTIRNYPEQHARFFINPCGTSSTIALTSKASQNQLALCVHIDTSAFNMNFSSCQIHLISECFGIAVSFMRFPESLKEWTQHFLTVPSNQQILLSEGKPFSSSLKWDECSSPQKLEIQKESTKEHDSAADMNISEELTIEPQPKITFWVQFTVNKLSLNLFGKLPRSHEEKCFQFQLISEEVITSLDMQEIYSKAKVKISSLNINSYLKKGSEWLTGPYGGVVLSCCDQIRSTRPWPNNAIHSHRVSVKVESHPFLLFTYTQASCRNANKKWIANSDDMVQSCQDAMRYISELDISLRPFDIILWSTMLKSFIEILTSLKSAFVINVPDKIFETDLMGVKFNNQNLPLMYVKSSTVRIFLPKHLLADENESYFNNDALSLQIGKNASSPDMICFCLDCISLTSQVENPLSRIILNAELYSNALKLKTLNYPGSDIEDRQYQLDICGLSFGSVFGNELTKTNGERKETSVGYSAIMGENPALEWNIGAINEGRKTNDQEPISMIPFITSFDLRLAVAPAIVSYGQSAERKNMEIVSGITVEISIANDIFIYFNATQMELLSRVINNHLESTDFSNENTQLQREMLNYDHKDLRDSGLESESSSAFYCNKSSPVHSEQKCRMIDCVPFEVFATASSISLIFFTIEDKEQKLNVERIRYIASSDCSFSKITVKNKKHQHFVQNTSEDFQEDDYDGSSDSSYHDKTSDISSSKKMAKILSSILISITQPHAFLKYHLLSQRFEASCFDFQIKGSNLEKYSGQYTANYIPVLTDFNAPYLDTRPGDPDEKTGIPPAFCTFTCEFLSQKPVVNFCVERPFKFNINSSLWEHYEFLSQSFFGKIVFESKTNETCFSEGILSDKKESKNQDIRFCILSHFGTMKFSTMQMVFEMNIDCSPDPAILTISCDEFKTELEMAIGVNKMQKIEPKISLQNLAIKLSTADEIWPLLLPSSASINLHCQFDPYFQITLYVDSEAVIFNISLKHLLILIDIKETILKFWNSRLKRVNHFSGIELSVATPISKSSNPLRKSWNDDLRKGSYCFIPSSEKQYSVPNAYEVVFTNAQDGHPGAMIWRYPEPRCITKIQICPVPLHDERNKQGKTQMIMCFVQWWDTLHNQFKTLCKFQLSETSQQILSFPLSDITTLTFSDLWRVILTCENNINEASKEQINILSPMVLAACMNIDSCFDESLIPSTNLLVSLPLLRINFYNVFIENGCINKFLPFTFDGTSSKFQEFMVLSCENLEGQYKKWGTGFKLGVSSSLFCSIIEYRNLTMFPIIDPMEFIVDICSSYECDRLPTVEIEMKIESCMLKISQSVIHSLKYALYSCSMVENAKKKNCSLEYMLPNFYMICNNTHELIRFGQVDTDESIILPSHKMHAYSWRSHKAKQLIHVCLESMKWNWSEGFDIDKYDFQEIKLVNNIVMRIIVNPLSHLQKQVIFEGYLKLFNYLSWDLSFKLNILEHMQESNKIAKQKEIITELKSCTHVSLLISQNFTMQLKAKENSSNNAQWSQYLEVNEQNQNMVFSLPGEKIKYALLQTRKEKGNDGINYMYIFLSPQLVIRNLLPFALQYESKNVEKFLQLDNLSSSILGEGKEFFFCDKLDFTEPLMLSFDGYQHGVIDVPTAQIKDLFFKPIENVNIEFMSHRSNHIKGWPYLNLSDDILASGRFCSCVERTPYLMPMQTKFCNLEITTEVSLKWNGLNTVLVDIKPWALFVNNLETDLIIEDHTKCKWHIPANSVITPPRLCNNFNVGVIVQDECYFSDPISIFQNINEQNCDVTSYSVNDFVSVLIKMKPSCQEVIAFQLKCTVHEKMYIIEATSFLQIKNNTYKTVHLTCFAALSSLKSKIKQNKMKSLVAVESSGAEKPVMLFTLLDDNQFISLNEKCMKISFYIAFCICDSSQHKWSRPLSLNFDMTADMRHTVSVPCDTNVMNEHCAAPYVLTSHLRYGILFLQLSDDPCPFLFICNQTNLQLFYGQCVAKNENVYVHEELDEEIPLPSLSPGESSYYTFPALQKQYPVPLDSMPKLHLGLKNKKLCLWSSPIDITYNSQFVCIPESTYVRVSQEQHDHTIRLIIELVNRVEFTAKEIRSRIGMSDHCITEKLSSDCFIESDVTKSSLLNESFHVKQKKISGYTFPENKLELKNYSSSPPAVCSTLRANSISFVMCDELQMQNSFSEVIRITIDDAFLYSRPNQSHGMIEKAQEVCICFGCVQVDNQVDGEERGFDFPVILKPHCDVKSRTTVDSTPLFLVNKARENSLITIDMVLNTMKHNISIKTMSINFQPFSLYFEDSFYSKVLDLYASYLPYDFHEHRDQDLQCKLFSEEIISLSLSMIQPIWIKHFKIAMKDVYLTVHASLKLYLSVENSKLKFNDFEKNELFTNYHELGRMIIMHYLTGTLFRAGWVVAALDLLGNPANFARAVGGGLSDFVLLPYHGFFNGPRAFFSGLSHGATSLVSGISSGAIICVTNLAESISRNMDILSLDVDHLERQEALRRQPPSGISEGLFQGLSGLGISLLGAVAGVVDHPLQVLVSPSSPVNTAKGVVGGLAKGLIGVLTKPVGGAAEFISQTGHGFLQGAGWLSQPKRKYPPSSIFSNKLHNSNLKFLCKIVETSGLGNMLFVVDAVYVNEAGKFENVVLLLMSDFLCIFSENKDMQHKTFAVREIKCEKATSSSNALHITHCERSEESFFEIFPTSKDRVVDYVQGNWQYNSGASHQHFEDYNKEDVTTYTFFVDSNLINVFHALFSAAKRKLQRKGFLSI